MNKKVFYFLCLLTLLFPPKLWAQEPYAVVTGYETNGQTLTFYYDDQKENRGGMEIGPFAEYDNRPWGGDQQLITEVVFDTSFAGYTELTSTAYWFASIASLNTINGIKNLKTDNVTDMREMFAGCMNLTSLDLSRFYTSNVTDMQYMFAGCDNLTTIYVGNGWDVSKVTNSDEMFSGCFNLKGGAGTEFNQGQMGVTYAHVDGGENNPGYLTYLEDLDARKEELNMLIGEIYERLMVIKEMLEEKDPNRAATELWETLNQLEEEDVEISLSLEDAQTEADLDDIEWKIDELEERVSQLYEEVENYGLIAEVEPYAVLSDNNTVLTFYYDDQKAARNGMSVGPFTYDGQTSWYNSRSTISTVVFDDSFAECTTLTSTAWWFYDCSNLTSIIGIANLKTENVTDMRAMFRGCSRLSSIDVSGFNTSKVEDIGYMFRDCSSLTSLNLSNFITDNVIEMSSVFDGCSALTSVNLTSFNTAKVTDMHQMFKECSSLTTLDLTNFNTGYVTTTSGMFDGCSALTSLDLSSFNTANVTAMHYMFSGCSVLTTIYVGDGWTTIAVEDSENMFAGCYSLIGGAGTTFNQGHTDSGYAHIDGGENDPGYFTSKAEIQSRKDELNMRIEQIYHHLEIIETILQEKDPDQIATELWETLNQLREEDIMISEVLQEAQTVEALDDCEWKIEELEERVSQLHEEVENYGLIAEVEPYAVLSDNNTVLTFYYDDQKAARNGMSVGPFANYEERGWYEACESITSVVFDSSFIECTTLTSTAFWFYGCSGLTSLDLSSLNTANVTNMYSMFMGCSSLTTIYVGDGWSTIAVEVSENMFTGCYSLKGGRGTEYTQDHTDVAFVSYSPADT